MIEKYLFDYDWDEILPLLKKYYQELKLIAKYEELYKKYKINDRNLEN